ncbi:MAG: L,D-transpeptidase family protein [Polyangiaceae bacterium]|nr:L,D-transpeptidase family protein [Polyangiaceae bacterium]
MTRPQAPRPPLNKGPVRHPGAPPEKPAGPPARRPHPGRPHREAAPQQAEGGAARASLVSTAVGFVAAAALAGAAAWASGCHGEAPPGPSTEGPRRTASLPAPPPPKAAAPASAAPQAVASGAPAQTSGPAPEASDTEKPYTGPLLGALAMQTPVYPTMELSKKRLGYIRLGGKVPVDPKPVKKESCPKGWYRLLDGGYVCGKWATTDMSNPQVKLGITAPNLDDILPYKYAHNTAHGTPLYRSVPSKEEMFRYEPYLEAAKRAKKKEQEDKGDAAAAAPSGEPAEPKPAASAPAASAPAASAPVASAPAGEPADGAAQDKAAAAAAAASIGILDPPPPEAEEEPDKPWWQKAHDKSKPLNVTLADLDKDADGTVAKRMVKGFFVAVDKTFGWNNRLWYKTTSGLVAPSDRMYIVKPPSSQGIDFPADAKQVGFITASKAAKYELDPEKKKLTVLGPIERFAAFGLTGETATYKTVVYRKTTQGWWMKGIDGTFTEPGPPPADLAPGEKWVDVNLTRKTLVAMAGDKPVYAALVSPGRRSKNKKKNHPTKPGVFRIREKHVAVTMDGDGTVAGDLPYSIEDVPYVAYYDGSYALHGAFWHNNFGREMSHGCVNLSPLDAKKIFFWVEPKLPRGWHAVWATSEHPGTLVSIHGDD